MKTALPSGVWMCPVVAVRLNVCTAPAVEPGAHTIPSFGAPAGRLEACGASPAMPRTNAAQRPSHRDLLVIVAPLSDIGLAHHGLARQRVLVDADLGHHPARSGRTEIGELPPVPVLEEVDVVVAATVRARGPEGAVGR